MPRAGMPSVALISASGTGGSWMSMAIARRQLRERLAQRRVQLGREQLPLRGLGLPARGVRGLPGTGLAVRGAPDPVAFAVGGGGEPACQRGWVAERVELAGELPPYGLADGAGIGVVDAVPTADRPYQRDVPLDECVPCLAVAGYGAGHQVSDRRAIAHPDCLGGHHRVPLPPCRTGGPAHLGPNLAPMPQINTHRGFRRCRYVGSSMEFS